MTVAARLLAAPRAVTSADLGLLALFDAHAGGSASSVADASSSAQTALAFGASTAAPTYLGYSGTPYVFLPGVTGSFLSTPDVAAVDLAGDFEIVARIAPNAPTGAQQVILSKYTTVSPQRAYMLRLGSAGAFEAFVSPAGSSGIQLTSSAAWPFSAGTFGWGKEEFDLDNGSGSRLARFYTAADQTSEPGSFTQLGTDQTSATAMASLFNSSADLLIGAYESGGTQPFLGKVSRVILRDGIGGIAVANFDATSCGQTGYTDSAGRVWTMHYHTAGLVPAVKSIAANDPFGGLSTDGTNDYATGPTGAIPALTASDGCTLFTVTRPRATMAVNATFFSTRSGTGPGVTLRMASATTVVADISDGTTTVTTPAVTITPGLRYVLGVTVRPNGVAYCFANTTSGGTVARTGNNETGTALTVFATSALANFCRTHSRVPFASAGRSLTHGEVAALVAEFRGGS